MELPTVWTAVVLLLIVGVLWSQRSRPALPRLPLPPGPPRDPVLGNERQKPASHSWKTYRTWRNTYGDVIYLRYGTEGLLVLNSVRAAVELLDQRSAIYSSRPPAIMAHEFATAGLSVSMTPAGTRFRKHRKAFQSAFGSAKLSSFHGPIAKEAVVLAHDLLQAPDSFEAHYKRFAASVMFSTVYDCRVTSPHAPVLQAIEEANRNFLQAFRPEGYLVDRYPLLRLLPKAISPWRRLADKWFRHEMGIYDEHYRRVLRLVQQGQAPTCIATDVIENRTESGLSHAEAAFTTGSMLAAGSDSTAMTLSCLTMAACLYPDAVQRARREIDDVVGLDRLPSFADVDRMPYCQAFVQEVLRWRPFTPGGTPHYAQKDDVYRGWRIPKGTTVMANLWSIHNDEAFWHRPMDMLPERHLGESGQESEPWPSTRRVFTFGFGRRICPGRQLATLNLSMTSVLLLWAFDFGHAVDKEGKRIDIDPNAFTDGLASHPLPFRCAITPRSDRVKVLIEQQYERDRD